MDLLCIQQSFRIRAIGIGIFAYMRFTRDLTLLLLTHREMAKEFTHTQFIVMEYSCYFFILRCCSVEQGELCMFGVKYPNSGSSYKER